MSGPSRLSSTPNVSMISATAQNLMTMFLQWWMRRQRPKVACRYSSSILRKILKYPLQARRMGIEGKVFVEFIVETDGSITNVRAKKGIGAGCDEEAVMAVQNCAKMESWKKQRRGWSGNKWFCRSLSNYQDQISRMKQKHLQIPWSEVVVAGNPAKPK